MAGAATTMAYFANNSPMLVLPGPVRIQALTVTNPTGALGYLQIFDAVPANINLGTTVPLITVAVPTKTTNEVVSGGGWRLFNNGLTVAGTTAEVNAAVATMLLQTWVD